MAASTEELKKILPNLRYSRYRGLCYTSSNHNLLTQIETITGDTIALMRAQQTAMAHRSFFIRFVYWLFNIQNYTKNAYLLTAWDIKKGDKHMLPTGTMAQHGWLTINWAFNAIQAAYHFCLKKINKSHTIYIDEDVDNDLDYGPSGKTADLPESSPLSVTALATASLPSSPGTPEKMLHSANSLTFQVTSDMIPYLEQLGFQHITIGTSLTWTQIKSQYHRIMKQVHPDCSGSSRTTPKAQNATGAFATLKEKVNSPKSDIIRDGSKTANNGFGARLDSLHQGIEAMVDYIVMARRLCPQAFIDDEDSDDEGWEHDSDPITRLEAYCHRIMAQYVTAQRIIHQQEKEAAERHTLPIAATYRPASASESSSEDSIGFAKEDASPSSESTEDGVGSGSDILPTLNNSYTASPSSTGFFSFSTSGDTSNKAPVSSSTTDPTNVPRAGET